MEINKRVEKERVGREWRERKRARREKIKMCTGKKNKEGFKEERKTVSCKNILLIVMCWGEYLF